MNRLRILPMKLQRSVPIYETASRLSTNECMESHKGQICFQSSELANPASGLINYLLSAAEPEEQTWGRLRRFRSLTGFEAGRRHQGLCTRSWILVLPALLLTSMSVLAYNGYFSPQSVGATSGAQNVTISVQSSG